MKDVVSILRRAGLYTEEVSQAADLLGDTDALWRSLIAQGLVTEQAFFEAVAAYNNVEYVDITGVSPSPETLSKLSSDFCRRNSVIPIGHRDNFLFLAISDPNALRIIDDASALTGMDIAPKIVIPTAIQSAIDRFMRSDEELDKLSGELQGEGDGTELEGDTDELTGGTDDAPVVRFVNLLISQAVQDRASDIHVEPGEKYLRVRFRIDGVLHEMQKADRSIQAGVISRLKIMADIDIAEKRKPQDGRMSVRHNGSKIDIRVAALPTVWGEKMVMRILDHSSDRRDLDSMDLSTRDITVFRNATRQPHGMILVTGPTGSGKSTTLYTTLSEVSNESINVITVEDPVEKKIEGVNQIQINKKADMTFSAALRSILRADPDVVLIGEIRDSETAQIATEASLTGHLVLSTLHTNGAPEAITRIVEMGVEPYLAGTAISCVMAQRLARRLCSKCKVPIEIDPEVLKELNFEHTDAVFFGPKGCSECSETGYRGRVAVVEIMEIDEDIERLAVSHAPSSEIRKSAVANGMTSLRQDGFRRVAQGLTTLEEIIRVTA